LLKGECRIGGRIPADDNKAAAIAWLDRPQANPIPVVRVLHGPWIGHGAGGVKTPESVLGLVSAASGLVQWRAGVTEPVGAGRPSRSSSTSCRCHWRTPVRSIVIHRIDPWVAEPSKPSNTKFPRL
jgi:hypothetical protein